MAKTYKEGTSDKFPYIVYTDENVKEIDPELIPSGSITADKIADGSVTFGKLQDSVKELVQVETLELTTTYLTSGSVNAFRIGNLIVISLVDAIYDTSGQSQNNMPLFELPDGMSFAYDMNYSVTCRGDSSYSASYCWVNTTNSNNTCGMLISQINLATRGIKGIIVNAIE